MILTVYLLNETSFVYAICTAILVYDHILTIDDEVNKMWKRKINIVTAIFALNRYAILVTAIIAFVLVATNGAIIDGEYSPMGVIFSPIDAISTETFLVVVTMMGFISSVVSSAFVVLRVWAVWRGDLRVVIPVLILTLLMPGGNIYVGVFTISGRALASELFIPLSEDAMYVDTGLILSLAIALQVTSIICEVAALVLTWCKTFKHLREAKGLKMGTTVTSLLHRDGTIYFLTLIAINIIFYARYQTFMPQNVYGPPQIMLNSVLISRFLLDLRGFNSADDYSVHFMSIGTIPGTTPVNNMGDPFSEHVPAAVSSSRSSRTDLVSTNHLEGALQNKLELVLSRNNVPMANLRCEVVTPSNIV